MNTFLHVSDNPKTPPLDPTPTQVEIQTFHRQIPISRWKHMRGYHPVRPGHPQIGFESRLEASFISFIALLSQLVSIKSQPVTVTFVYQGRRYRYTPDFLVTLSSVPPSLKKLGFAKQTLVEVKPEALVADLQEQLTRNFAALEIGIGFPSVVITEKTIAALKTEVSYGS